jgi:RES domain-containing protein
LQSLADTDWSRCQLVGGAAEFLDHDGLLIPSARAQGTNLVIFPNRRDPAEELEIIEKELISE